MTYTHDKYITIITLLLLPAIYKRRLKSLLKHYTSLTKARNRLKIKVIKTKNDNIIILSKPQ
jgi:hypothetical protein